MLNFTGHQKIHVQMAVRITIRNVSEQIHVMRNFEIINPNNYLITYASGVEHISLTGG